MKKTVALAIVLILILSFFTACGKRVTEETSVNTTDKVTVTTPATSRVENTTGNSVTNVPDTNVGGAVTTEKTPATSGVTTSGRLGILRNPVMR